MRARINRKRQRLHYLLTVANDMTMNSYPPEIHPKNFDQIAGGIKLFKDRWTASLGLRFCFCAILPIIMLCYDIVILCKYTYKVLFNKKTVIHPKELFVSQHSRLYSVGTYAGLIKDDSVWLATPFDAFTLPKKYKVLTVYDYLSVKDVLMCMLQSMRCRWHSVSRFGYKTYFLTQKAFSWMVTDVAMRKIPCDVELLFANNVDRLAMLIDKLPHYQKSLVQHGGLHFYHKTGEDPRFSYQQEYGFWIWNCLFRFHSLTRMYCYTEKDKIAYQISNMACVPEYVIIGYSFKPAFKPNKKSILIIAHPMLYLDKENYIVSQLQGLNVKIYLKNHPVQSDSMYHEMMKKYEFVYLPGGTKELPDVDLVFSYDSTLAYEYEALGTDVMYYETFNMSDVRKIVMERLSISI